MPDLGRLGIGGIIFLIGAVIYIVNLMSLSRRGKLFRTAYGTGY